MTSTSHFKRGDLAILTAWNAADHERCQIVRAENITVGLREAQRQERWLHIRTQAGARLLVHPSALIEACD